MPSLCVITPTISRSTLRRALLSAELEPGDEWLVIGDGRQPDAAGLVSELWQAGRNWLRFIVGPETGDKGNSQRNLGMHRAEADYFLFLDDDDLFLPGAIEAIRGQLNGEPVMFRMKHPNGVIWQEQLLTPGNVGGSMLCVPNEPGKLPKWPERYIGHGSDFVFISDVEKRFGGLVWAGDVIIEVAPEGAKEND